MNINHNPARNVDESFDEYRSRRRLSNQVVKWYLQGRFPEQKRWNSLHQGTFRLAEHDSARDESSK